MNNSLIMERVHAVMGLSPVADGFSGTVYSDIVNLKNYDRCAFLVVVGVGSTGVSTLTVQASDDVSASNVSAVPFYYRVVTTGDTEGSVVAVASTGFVTTAGSDQLYWCEIQTDALIASGYHYARLKAVESVNDPVLAGIIILLDGARYQKPVKESAIV